jgi:hypothetical protein
MYKRISAVLVILLALSISSAASAKGFELGQIGVGACATYGVLTISDHQNYDTYGFLTPTIGVNASYEVLPGARLLGSYTMNVKSLSKPYLADWVGNVDDVIDPVYTNLGVSAAVAVTDHVDLVAGWTRFTSGYGDDDGTVDVVNVGSGFKMGAAVSVPIMQGLSLSGSYAFLPRVSSVTIENEEYTETYVGQGHEAIAGLTYTTKLGLAVNLGFRFEHYDGVSDCCIEDRHDLVDHIGGGLGISYTF